MSGLDVLRIWARDYLKSRDSIFRQIESLEEGHDTIDIIRRGNKHLYLILPELDKAKIDKLEKDLRLTVVTYNTKKKS
jgi:hypothetical protein